MSHVSVVLPLRASTIAVPASDPRLFVPRLCGGVSGKGVRASKEIENDSLEH